MALLLPGNYCVQCALLVPEWKSAGCVLTRSGPALGLGDLGPWASAPTLGRERIQGAIAPGKGFSNEPQAAAQRISCCTEYVLEAEEPVGEEIDGSSQGQTQGVSLGMRNELVGSGIDGEGSVKLSMTRRGTALVQLLLGISQGVLWQRVSCSTSQ